MLINLDTLDSSVPTAYSFLVLLQTVPPPFPNFLQWFFAQNFLGLKQRQIFFSFFLAVEKVHCSSFISGRGFPKLLITVFLPAQKSLDPQNFRHPVSDFINLSGDENFSGNPDARMHAWPAAYLESWRVFRILHSRELAWYRIGLREGTLGQTEIWLGQETGLTWNRPSKKTCRHRSRMVGNRHRRGKGLGWNLAEIRLRQGTGLVRKNIAGKYAQAANCLAATVCMLGKQVARNEDLHAWHL